jgi:hypothetical protein
LLQQVLQDNGTQSWPAEDEQLLQPSTYPLDDLIGFTYANKPSKKVQIGAMIEEFLVK